jgi:hypothetical protein
MIIQTAPIKPSSEPNNNSYFRAILSALLMSLGACAGLQSAPVSIGEPETQVIATLGEPSHIYADLDDTGKSLLSHVLEYMGGPFGQTTYMAHINGQGRLTSYEQVLTLAKFATIKIGETTREEVLRIIGAPSETSYLSLPNLEVWSYPYKENPVSDSIMYVHFDNGGVVRKMLNGPDLRRDTDHRGLFGLR